MIRPSTVAKPYTIILLACKRHSRDVAGEYSLLHAVCALQRQTAQWRAHHDCAQYEMSNSFSPEHSKHMSYDSSFTAPATASSPFFCRFVASSPLLVT